MKVGLVQRHAHFVSLPINCKEYINNFFDIGNIFLLQKMTCNSPKVQSNSWLSKVGYTKKITGEVSSKIYKKLPQVQKEVCEEESLHSHQNTYFFGGGGFSICK